MYAKIAVFFALVAASNAGFFDNLFHKNHHSSQGHGVSSQSIVQHHGHGELKQVHDHHDLHQDFHHGDHLEHVDEHAYPKYEYKYSVNDDKTEDQKNHWESRDGDNVQGQYSFIQPDGSTRTVTYTANDHDGFKAQVSTFGGNQHAHEAQAYEQLAHQNYDEHNYHH